MKRTGVELEFIAPATGQAAEQLNILLTGGDLPDLIEYNWTTFPGGPQKALGDEYILELGEPMEKWAPNLKAVLADRPDVDRMVKTDEGHYYVFPFIRGDRVLQTSAGIIMRADWLEELNLEVPETIDEWHTVLTAFKERGAKAPLTYELYKNDWGLFSNPWGVRPSFYLDDEKKVRYGRIEEGYRDYLKTFSQWYKEGLIDPDFATVDNKQCAAKMSNGEAGVSIAWAASGMGVWLTAGQKTDDKYNLVGAPTPVLNKGDRQLFGNFDQAYAGSGSVAISTSCTDVETATRFLDYAYGKKGHMLFNFGVEGVSYTMDGDKPTYTEAMYNDPDGKPFAQVLAGHIRANYNGPFVQDARYIDQYQRTPQQQHAYKLWGQTEAETHVLPPISATPDESKELAQIMNDVSTYTDTMFLKFLFGDESLDNWDDYVSRVKSMNIDRAIEIQEAALARYNAR